MATLEPAIAAPVAPGRKAEGEWSRDAAVVEIVRGRLEGLGPVTQETLAASLGVASSEVAAALTALEAEGFAMRGRFTPGIGGEEWCERRLLARIHNYTVKRLRAEIEPVAPRDFLRFLLAWQHVVPDARMQGPAAVDATVEQLEGFASPAGAWESEILPARIADYEPAWLDDRCLAGHVAWTRPRPRNARSNGNDGRASPVRTTPIMLLARRHAAFWTVQPEQADAAFPGPRAQAVAEHIRQHGASFFDELMEGTGLLQSQLEDALAELVALGVVSSDSFGGLRALLVPSGERKPIAGGRRRRRTVKFGMEDAGRWALTRRARPVTPAPGGAPKPRRSSMSLAFCSAATAWCSGACWSARPPGCRHGGTSCGHIAGSRIAATSAAVASFPVFRASSSRCPMRSACCASCVAGRPAAHWFRSPEPTRSTWSAS